MAPRKTFNEANPATIPLSSMSKINVSYTASGGKQAVRADYVPKPGSGYEILTDDVLNSGNLEVLYKFREEHEDELNDPKNAPAKRYMDSRIQTAEKVEALEQKKKLDIAEGKLPPKLEVDSEGGFIGFSGLTYPDYQTSANGCWSASYSLLLKSRGVDLSQEDIRRWRPDYPEGTAEENKANPERKLLMNTDRGNSIYPNADLAGKVLPNTAVNLLRLEPFETEQLTIGGKPLSKQQKKIVEDEYMAQVKTSLQKSIIEAITVHRSPVSVSWDGHFVTITGISPDGNTLRYEESLGAERNAKRTRTMTVNELVKQTMSEHTHNGQYYNKGYGVELTWLSDLSAAEHSSPQPSVDEVNKDYLKVDDSGKIMIDIPADAPGVSAAGSPVQGQVNGKAVENMLVLDQKKLTKKLGVPKVEGWGEGGGIMFGSGGRYYPDRVLRPKDPALMHEALKAQSETFKELKDMCRSIVNGQADDEDVAEANKGLAALKCLDALSKGKKKDVPAQEDADLDEEEKELKKIENGDIETSREQLKSLIDYLNGRPDEKGKTRFETLFVNKHENACKRYINALKNANDALGLGKGAETESLEAANEKMQADYKKAKEIQNKKIAEERAFSNKISNYWAVAKANASGSILDTKERREMVRALALITANYTLHQQMVEKGIDPPYPSEKDVNSLVPKVERSQAFNTVVTGVRPWILNKQSTVADFITEFYNEQEEIQKKEEAVDRYAIPEKRLDIIQSRAEKIADHLDATETGSYMGLGIISRRENSDEFEKAKKAIRDFSTAEAPTAKDVKKYCDVVMNYLSGKEKRRNREFGRERWNDCMTFLANTMPRDKFEKYCDTVNKERNVRPNSPDYVGPENFYMKGTTVRNIMNDSKNRIHRGEGTLRDYARLIAVREYGDDHGMFIGGDKCDTERSKDMLRRDTDKILSDPGFKDFIESMPKETLNDLMSGDADDLKAAWEAHREIDPLDKNTDKTADPGSIHPLIP